MLPIPTALTITPEPLDGVTPGLKSSYVLGGIGIIPGAALGGLLSSGNICNAFGMSDFRDAIVFGILLLILDCKTKDILGKNVKEKV